VDRQRPSLSPPRRGGWTPALLTGLLAAGAIIVAYAIIGRRAVEPGKLRDTLAPLGLTHPAVYAAGAAYWVLVNSVLEEYAFRWFIVRKCEALMGAIPAIMTSASILVLHHSVAMAAYFPWWANLVGSLAIFTAGAAWSWLYIRYRSVWVPYLSHALADIAIFAVGAYVLFHASAPQ
jgi:membrane protease YdiL (CAAX protease family)